MGCPDAIGEGVSDVVGDEHFGAGEPMRGEHAANPLSTLPILCQLGG